MLRREYQKPGIDLLDNDMFNIDISFSCSSGTRWGNVRPHLLLHLDLLWDLDLQRNLKYLSWQYIFPAMEIVFSFCMHRVSKKFKDSFLKDCFINIQFLQLASETMTFYLVHPNINLSIVYVTVCYLFVLLLLCIQLHDWLHRIVSNLQYLILILVWGCNIDWTCFVSPIWELYVFHLMIAYELRNDRKIY